ncbi:MAG: hypothetical protein GXP33_03835 [Spirochaetes bacterium]|nr:hypothetical protein [Spirochaetota bacterium]
MNGTIVDIKPVVEVKRLRIITRVREENGRIFNACLPDRELSAILPRFILLGRCGTAPEDLLATIASIIRKAVRGRKVRYWKYRDTVYVSFLSWRGVKFTGEEFEKTSKT